MPGFYCYRKGIDCQATDTVPTPATLATRKTPTPSSESNQDTVSDGDNAGLAYTTPGPQPLPLPLPSPISVLLDAAVICASAPNDSTPPFVAPSETTPITAISPALTSTSLPDVSSPDPPQSISGCFSAIAHGAAIYTLDDNDGLTAHCMGLSGEQDTELLASFRAAVMNEVDSVDADILQVYPGGNIGIEGSQPPVHFNMIRDEFMPLDNAAKKASSDRIEAIVQGCDDHLVRVYFRHVHPVYPVLSKTRFLQAYAADRQSIPASLRGAVYGIASNFWHRDQIQTLGPATMTTTTATGTATATSPLPCAATMFHLDQHELFEQALASLQRELHGPNLWTLQACLLLIHENSADNATIETPRVWMLASQAVACAQVIGLHRDPMAWQLAAWEKHLRRKLWWATFAIDVWSSVCHGNPPHIYQGSFTTSPPAMEDMALGEDVPDSLRYMIDEDSASSDTAVCARFLNTISVSCIVHKLLLSSLSVLYPVCSVRHLSFECVMALTTLATFYSSDVAYVESMKDPLSREAPLLQTRRQLQDWSLLLPRCISMESTPAAGVHQHNNGIFLPCVVYRRILLVLSCILILPVFVFE